MTDALCFASSGTGVPPIDFSASEYDAEALKHLLTVFENFEYTDEMVEEPYTDHNGFVDFSTKTISINVVDKTKMMDRKAIVADVFKMIRFYVQMGDDLEYMLDNISPELVDEINGLVGKFNLISFATDAKAMTLSRVCESFPAQTCIYQCVIPNPLVPSEVMGTVIPGYPRVLMSTAFAYFIPDKNLEFCTLIRQAHMLYRYVLYFITRHGMSCRKIYEVIISFELLVLPDIIANCLQQTHAAINRSHMPYEKQIQMLSTTNLVTVDDEIVTESESVRRAAKKWNDLTRGLNISAMEQSLRIRPRAQEVDTRRQGSTSSAQ